MLWFSQDSSGLHCYSGIIINSYFFTFKSIQAPMIKDMVTFLGQKERFL